MDVLDVARWQFAITTVYHFLFVPITIGMSLLVACLQTAWVRTGNVAYLRATKFWGSLFLINFAMGVVTGIVQEFQFGMNWSDYSRFVGDVFGAPLAIEGLLAFFLESTFLGLWIFGWNKLPKKVHLATIWLASIGTVLSAYFILAANSWMQNPVGFTVNETTDRAELTSLWAVLTSDTTLLAFAHTLMACLVTGGALMLGVAAWHLRRGNQPEVFRPSFRLGAWVLLLAGVGVIGTGDLQARLMTTQEPMKMAAAEAVYTTTDGASFSVLTITSADGREELYSIRIPKLLSLMTTGTLDGEVEGIDDLQEEAVATFGEGDYVPYVPVVYWSFRAMVGLGGAVVLVALAGLWLTRKQRVPTSRWLLLAAGATALAPLVANSAGWIMTESGRQPWTVYEVLTVANSVSNSVSLGEVLTSLIVFTLLYGGLAVVEVTLLLQSARKGAPEIGEPGPPEEDSEALTFVY